VVLADLRGLAADAAEFLGSGTPEIARPALLQPVRKEKGEKYASRAERDAAEVNTWRLTCSSYV